MRKTLISLLVATALTGCGDRIEPPTPIGHYTRHRSGSRQPVITYFFNEYSWKGDPSLLKTDFHDWYPYGSLDAVTKNEEEIGPNDERFPKYKEIFDKVIMNKD